MVLFFEDGEFFIGANHCKKIPGRMPTNGPEMLLRVLNLLHKL